MTQLLAEINDAMVGTGEAEHIGNRYQLRKSTRAIVQNGDGKIALQYLATHDFHKLPGGGIEPGESVTEALTREIHEEIGCAITVKDELGIVIEFRNKYELVQLSYGFVAEISGPIGEPTLEEAEIAEGLTLLWLDPHEALRRLKSGSPSTYESYFIQPREVAFLEAYLDTIAT